MIYGWIWIAVIATAIVIETLTDQLVSIWFVPAAAVCIVLDFLSLDVVWQVLIFLLISAVGIILSKTVFAKYLAKGNAKTNIEAIVGEKCIVTERIDNFAGCGLAKVRGQIWSARSVSDDDIYEIGDVLNVVAIEGVKLICKK